MSAALSSVSFSLLPAVSGFDYAIGQPLFPGKLILWLLFMLSLLSWAVMVSKAISFHRMRGSDAKFSEQLKRSRHPLQLFERNYSDDFSMRWVIYNHGASEAAFQMLGSPERDETFGSRLHSSPGMSDSQLKAVREAFTRGEQAAGSRLRLGSSFLSAAAAGGPFLGLLGMVWILMQTFADPSAGADSPGIAGALAVMVVGLLVATPAVFGQIIFSAAGRERMRQLADFRAEAVRLIERFYGSETREPIRRSAAPEMEEMPVETESAPEPESEPVEIAPEPEPLPEPQQRREEPRRLEPHPVTVPEPETEPELAFVENHHETEALGAEFTSEDGETVPLYRTPFSEPEINPIAQQTAGLTQASSAV